MMPASLSERRSNLELGYVLAPQGLTVTRELSKTEWIELGKTIVARIEGSTWALGDWLIEGGRDKRDWVGGSTYDRAARVTGYSKEHLSNAYRVARAFQGDARRPALAWSTHKESLRVNEPILRGELLTLAASKKWSADDLGVHINKLAAEQREKLSDQASATKVPSRGYYKSPEVRCPTCGTQFTIKGHKV